MIFDMVILVSVSAVSFLAGLLIRWGRLIQAADAFQAPLARTALEAQSKTAERDNPVTDVPLLERDRAE